MAKKRKPRKPKRCGAKGKRTGKPCRNWGLKNGRCRYHGGLSPGPPEGNRSAWKHGIYSRHMTAKDKALVVNMTHGELTEEIVVLKVQLARAIEAQAKGDAVTNPDAAHLHVDEVVTGDTKRVVRRRRDYDRIVVSLTQRIKDLTLAQELLLKEGAAGVPMAVRMEVTYVSPDGKRKDRPS
jgi:hypothetical protein